MLQILLESAGGFRTTSAMTLDSALAAVAEKPDPDVVLLDLDMPGMNGLSGFERMLTATKAHVVLFSGQARQETINQAMAMGVRGYIPKTLAPRSFISAIRFIALGEVYYPPDMLKSLMGTQQQHTPSNLSPRELAVVRAVASGSTNKQISAHVGIPETTVKMCLRSACQKLNVSNRTQIATTAMAKGLV